MKLSFFCKELLWAILISIIVWGFFLLAMVYISHVTEAYAGDVYQYETGEKGVRDEFDEHGYRGRVYEPGWDKPEPKEPEKPLDILDNPYLPDDSEDDSSDEDYWD